MLEFTKKNQKPPYETFYEENYGRVLRHVQGKTGNLADAEDLTSEIFLYCYSHYDDYDPEKASIVTWLYRIVNSRVKNYYRDHVAMADYDTVAQVMEDQSIDLDAGVYLEQLRGQLLRAIQRLPERQQKIVVMRYFQNRSSEEIAKALGTTPGNVRVMLSRALAKLSSWNDEYWKEYQYHG